MDKPTMPTDEFLAGLGKTDWRKVHFHSVPSMYESQDDKVSLLRNPQIQKKLINSEEFVWALYEASKHGVWNRPAEIASGYLGFRVFGDHIKEVAAELFLLYTNTNDLIS